MLNKISKRNAGNIASIALVLVIVFHLTVLLGIIPYNMVWGGRLESEDEMIVFELTSITINLIIILLVNSRTGRIKFPSIKIAGVFMWIFFLFFSLNTIGNLLAKHSLETYIFTHITFILAILMLRLALRD